MIFWLALAIGTIIACEIALRLGLGGILSRLTSTSHRAGRVLRSPAISDSWKERVLPIYARRIFTTSLTLFGCLLLIAAPVVSFAWFVTGSLEGGSMALMRPLPLVAMITLGVIYVWTRRKLMA